MESHDDHQNSEAKPYDGEEPSLSGLAWWGQPGEAGLTPWLALGVSASGTFT